jgi:hypothetical protein
MTLRATTIAKGRILPSTRHNNSCWICVAMRMMATDGKKYPIMIMALKSSCRQTPNSVWTMLSIKYRSFSIVSTGATLSSSLEIYIDGWFYNYIHYHINYWIDRFDIRHEWREDSLTIEIQFKYNNVDCCVGILEYNHDFIVSYAASPCLPSIATI